MLGKPALTYTTNIIFRCADLAARHPGRKPYRYIFVGPEGTWATIVAINGGDQWRMSIIGGETPRDLSTDNIHAAIRRAIGPLLQYEILSVVPWVRKELVAETYRKGPRVHSRRRRPRDVADRRLWDEHRDRRCRRPVMETRRSDRGLGRRNVCSIPSTPSVARSHIATSTEASGNLRRMLSPGPERGIARRYRSRRGAAPACWRGDDGSDAARMVHARHAPRISLRGLAGLRSGRNAPTPDDSREITFRPRGPAAGRRMSGWPTAARRSICSAGVSCCCGSARGARCRSRSCRRRGSKRVPLEVVSIDEPAVATAYERRLVLVRPDGHVAWRGDELAEPHAIIDTVCGLGDARRPDVREPGRRTRSRDGSGVRRRVR